jgi:hypothetical protein
MKIRKRLLAGLLAVNFAFLPLGPVINQALDADTTVAYASSVEEKKEIQKEQLQKALDDAEKIRETEAYKSSSNKDREAYEKAIELGNQVINKKDATGKQLRDATVAIDKARMAVVDAASAIFIKEAEIQNKIKVLKESVRKNEVTAGAARYLLENNPKSVAKFKTELETLLKKSEELCEKAKKTLKKYEK